MTKSPLKPVFLRSRILGALVELVRMKMRMADHLDGEVAKRRVNVVLEKRTIVILVGARRGSLKKKSRVRVVLEKIKKKILVKIRGVADLRGARKKKNLKILMKIKRPALLVPKKKRWMTCRNVFVGV
jgi:hypothetical protein